MAIDRCGKVNYWHGGKGRGTEWRRRGNTWYYPERSFFRGEGLLSSSRLLFVCSVVGEGGIYPGFTVVKELFENPRPPEDRAGDTVMTLVGVEGWSRPEVEDLSSGDGGMSCKITRYPCWINPKNLTSRVYILSRTSPKVAGINDDMSPGSALEHSRV